MDLEVNLWHQVLMLAWFCLEVFLCASTAASLLPNTSCWWSSLSLSTSSPAVNSIVCARKGCLKIHIGLFTFRSFDKLDLGSVSPIYGSSRFDLINHASQTAYQTLGGKKYELTKHLGNVLAVVGDTIHLLADSTRISAISTTDYFPCGLAMDGRTELDSIYHIGDYGIWCR